MKKILILSVCLLFITSIKAQQTPDTLRLTLPQAIDIALSESRTIKIANKEMERVDYSKKNAWNAFIPNLEGSAQYSKYLIPAKMSMFGQVMDSPTDFNSSLGLSVSLPIFAPALWHNIKMTEIEMQAAVQKAKASKINLKNEVTKAYYNVLMAQDSYNVLKDGYSLAQKSYEIAKKGYDIGTLAAYDYISAEVQLNNLMPNIIQVENGIVQAKNYLKILMGMDINVPVTVLNSLAEFEKDVVEVKGIKEYSLKNNADLQQLDIGRLQLQKTLVLQQSQKLPTLAAFGQFGYIGMGNKETSLNFGAMPIAVEASKEFYSQGFIVGLQLKVPITGVFTSRNKEKQLKIQAEALVLQREQTENALQLQALSTLDNMNKAAKRVETTHKSIELAEKAYQISSKRYENGAGSMIELQNAMVAITQSRLSYHQAITEYLTAKADLEKIIGN